MDTSYMEHQLFKITQNTIIKDPEGAVLILKHTTGNWLLPGGKINKGETWQEGIKRELKEETGILNFEVSKILDIDSWIENGEGSYVVTFIIDIGKTPEIKLGKEHIDYKWIKLSDLDEYRFWHKDIKKRIRMSFD